MEESSGKMQKILWYRERKKDKYDSALQSKVREVGVNKNVQKPLTERHWTDASDSSARCPYHATIGQHIL